MGGPGEKEKPAGPSGGLSEQPTGKGGGPGDKSTGTAGGPGEKGKGGEKTKQGIPGMVVGIEIPEIPQEKKTKKSGASSSSKKRQTKEQKKQAEIKELQENLALIIKTGFDMTALRCGPVWEVTDDEVKNIAGPLARIIERHGFSEAASQYGDYAALAVSSAMVVVPRYMIYQEIKKQGGRPENAGDTKRATTNNNPGNVRQNGPGPSSIANVKKLVPGLG